MALYFHIDHVTILSAEEDKAVISEKLIIEPSNDWYVRAINYMK